MFYLDSTLVSSDYTITQRLRERIQSDATRKYQTVAFTGSGLR